MTSIVRATVNDAHVLSELAISTFIESHGHSAKIEDINKFVADNYNPTILLEELSDPRNIFHLIYFNNQIAGYSKIILNCPYKNSKEENVTKLERIYLLKEFYGLNLGSALFDFIIELITKNDQVGVWLFVWTENERAFNFYKKKGFAIIGSYEYKISETHSNPNYQMLLKF